MRIVVLGAGVVGVTAAYELASDGHEVVVVDRQDKAAMETSFSNADWSRPATPTPGRRRGRRASSGIRCSATTWRCD